MKLSILISSLVAAASAADFHLDIYSQSNFTGKMTTMVSLATCIYRSLGFIHR